MMAWRSRCFTPSSPPIVPHSLASRALAPNELRASAPADGSRT